jgi:hypothetical protein
MSDTQSYKTVTFSRNELIQVAYALEVRLIALNAYPEHARDSFIDRAIDGTRRALAEVEAAL